MLSRKIIKSDAFAYGQNKEADAKYFVEPENVNKVKLLVIEVQQTIKNPHYMNFVPNDKK